MFVEAVLARPHQYAQPQPSQPQDWDLIDHICLLVLFSRILLVCQQMLTLIACVIYEIWVSETIIDAIDFIPLLPKVMECIEVSYAQRGTNCCHL